MAKVLHGHIFKTSWKKSFKLQLKLKEPRISVKWSSLFMVQSAIHTVAFTYVRGMEVAMDFLCKKWVSCFIVILEMEKTLPVLLSKSSRSSRWKRLTEWPSWRWSLETLTMGSSRTSPPRCAHTWKRLFLTKCRLKEMFYFNLKSICKEFTCLLKETASVV